MGVKDSKFVYTLHPSEYEVDPKTGWKKIRFVIGREEFYITVADSRALACALSAVNVEIMAPPKTKSGKVDVFKQNRKRIK